MLFEHSLTLSPKQYDTYLSDVVAHCPTGHSSSAFIFAATSCSYRTVSAGWGLGYVPGLVATQDQEGQIPPCGFSFRAFRYLRMQHQAHPQVGEETGKAFQGAQGRRG